MATCRALLLLGILLLLLFAEQQLVLDAAAAGLRSNGAKRSGDGRPGIHVNLNTSFSLDIKPRGKLVLGDRKGVTLTCTGSASHGAEISWLYNGKPCDTSSHCNGQVLRNGALRVKKKSIVQKRKGREGNGSSSDTLQLNEYRCLARTFYGAYLRSAPTNILYAELGHAFEESPKDLTVREGELARFSCLIDSVPFPPNLTWLHDGDAVPTNQTNKYALVPPGFLYIRAIKSSDAGSYRCVAVNEYINKTRKSKEAKLTVLPWLDKEKGRENEESPVLLLPQPSYRHTPLNGTNLRLACAASGYPTPTTVWTFVPRRGVSDGELKMPRKPRVLRHSSTGLAVLELNDLSASDTGIYSCFVKGFTAKSDQVQNVTIEVMVPPTFVKKPTNQVCPNGRTARFECQAQGVPPPRIYWLRNSENITINGRRTVYVKEYNKSELAISATVPADSGIYQCVAVNEVGEIWAAGRLQVNASLNSPAAPTALSCKALSPVKMFISWEPPKLLPATNFTAYTVYYRPVEGGMEEVSPPEPGNSTSVVVTKLLQPFTNYTFYVRLWNTVGPSDPSAAIICATGESVPTAAPNVTVDVINSTRLNVTWKPLTKKEAQGVVTEYKLEWRLYQQPSVHLKSLPVHVEQYVLTDLLPGERYDVRVLARTKEGWPNVNEAQLGWVTVTMPSPSDLAQVQIFIFNLTSVKTKWNIKSDSAFQFTSCKVTCKTEDGTIVDSVNLTRYFTEYTFVNLESRIYSFELCAFNLDKTLHCTTRQINLKKFSTSNIPTALEAVPLSSSSISLTWISGKLDKSTLFQACYHPVLYLNESFICIPANSTKVIINNLRPFTLYQFKVRLLGRSGDDDDDDTFSETIECYTNEDVPGKIESIESFTVNGTVRIVWKKPKDPNGIIRNYYVAYSSDRTEPRSAWKNVTVFGDQTFANLSGLVSEKRYFVVVQAATKVGSGDPSEPIVIFTGESSSEVHSTLDKKISYWSLAEPKFKGIVLGSCIGMLSIFACTIYLLHKKKQSSRLQSLHESAQHLRSRVLERNGNCSRIERTSVPNTRQARRLNDFELSVLYPVPNHTSCDSKGALANGLIESCAKEPLLEPWELNGLRKDLRITENPQYKPRENQNSLEDSPQKDRDELPALNSTQLTAVDYVLDGSNESLNNNMNHCTTISAGRNEMLPQKVDPTITPILQPNG